MARDRFQPNDDAPVYVISVAAELTGLHPQTLRQYDRLGLVSPGRTNGRGRRYTAREIELLREVARLSADGVSLIGIKRILELEAHIDALQRQVVELQGRVTTTPIAFRSGGPANQTFDVVVPGSGLYPYRLVWYERGGGAHGEFTSIDPISGTKTLINDPSVPTAVKSFTAVSAPETVVESSAAITGGYAVEPGAVFFFGSGRFEVPIAGDKRFYRVRGPGASRLVQPRVVDNKIHFELREP